jgi:ABC-type sugar transport system ATPase subunit
MDVIRKLKAQGIGIVYISHRLEEIYEIGDRVTILRDGKNVCTLDLHQRRYSVDEIIAYMVGRTLEEKFPKQHFERGEEILRVEHLSSPGRFEDVSFTLYKGELLSMAGLVGAGRTEVAKTIFGAYPKSGGKVYLYGRELDIREPADAIAQGISLLSEDRKDEGLVQNLSIETNLMMVDYKKFQKNGVFRKELKKKYCLEMAERLKLNTRNMQMKTSNLSGGNQQKVSLGKWLFGDCKLIILDEPTRGVDVGAKVEIYNAINDLLRQGIGVIMISSEMPEILGMSDRIIVMCEGRKTGELLREEATQEVILKYATGQEAEL